MYKICLSLFFVLTGTIVSQSMQGILLNKLNENYEIERPDFVRRYSTDGKGETLEVIFDIKNKKNQEFNLRMYVVALYETNKEDLIYPKDKPYRAWRKRNLNKEARGILLGDSLPKIDKNKLQKPDKNEIGFATFYSYNKYMEDNPELGIPFTLYGKQGSKFVEEKDHAIRMTRSKTNINVKFFVSYEDQDRFYNRVGVMIYDSSLKKIVYKQFYKFNSIFKHR